MDIKIKAKLQAYTKGILPTKVSELENDLDFISDVTEQGIYVRAKGEWIKADDALEKTKIQLLDDSGLNLIEPPEGSFTYQIGIRKWEGTQLELPATLQNDTTYYVQELTPNLYINGGTAWSDGNNEYITLSEYGSIISGGNSSTTAYNTIMYPIDSKGVYNG